MNTAAEALRRALQQMGPTGARGPAGRPRSAALLGLAAFALLIVTATIDAMTDRTLAVAFFYLPPIVWSAWYAPRAAGWLVTVLCFSLWTAVDYSDLRHALDAAFVFNALVRLAWFVTVLLLVRRLRLAVARRQALIEELQAALAEVRTLTGLLPICAWCKNVRDDGGYWQRVETYVERHSHASFTHGICPACVAKMEEDSEGAVGR